MKKIAVLILAVTMLFVIVSSSLANSVSLGYLVNGECKVKDDGDKYTYDAKNIILGGSLEISKKFSISGELTDCDLESDEHVTYDNRTYKIKGNYSILQTEQLCLDLAAGYLYRERSTHLEEREYTTLILGIGANFNLAENMNIIAGFEYGLSPDGEAKSGGLKVDAGMDSLLDYQVDFNYYITKKFGLSLGYRSSCWDYEDDDGDKDTISGITTIVTYKF